jgi:hypothetical protein
MNRAFRSIAPLLFLFSVALADAQGVKTSTPPNPQTQIANSGGPVQVCREKLYSVFPAAHLISPEGVHVAVPEKEVETALGRGFKYDRQALLDEVRAYGNGETVSSEQAIMAKLSDEQLTALYDDIATCGLDHRDVLSRNDLVDWGIAMAEIAYARQYRAMGALLVKNDEERVGQYNALVAKYNELRVTCSH